MTFDEQIFLGSGEYSLQQVGKLHQLLDEALSLLGGLQHPPVSTEQLEYAAEEVAIDEYRLECLVRELCIALLGRLPSRRDKEK